MVDFTNKTFRETYRDFYDANDGYYRVLYNSGRALQARELIEQQTIIQEEIARSKSKRRTHEETRVYQT